MTFPRTKSIRLRNLFSSFRYCVIRDNKNSILFSQWKTFRIDWRCYLWNHRPKKKYTITNISNWIDVRLVNQHQNTIGKCDCVNKNIDDSNRMCVAWLGLHFEINTNQQMCAISISCFEEVNIPSYPRTQIKMRINTMRIFSCGRKLNAIYAWKRGETNLSPFFRIWVMEHEIRTHFRK